MSDRISSLSQDDRDLIESITGHPVGDVSDVVRLGGAKFIPGEEDNEKGQHVIRRVLAWRAYEQRLKTLGSLEDPDVQEFFREGIIIKDLAGLNPEEYIPQIFAKLAGESSVQFQKFKKEQVTHIPDDVQYALHSDAFYPIVKGWIIERPIPMKKGPFNYVRGSHGVSENRLRWDYQCSLLPSHAIYHQHKSKPTLHGSFRVHVSGDPEKESEILNEFGLEEPEPMLADVGFAVIANTCGLHKRGRAKPGTKRRARVAKYRSGRPFSISP